MILDDAKAARKAREQQEELERQRENDDDSDQDSFPAHQPTSGPSPPAYEPASPTSPSAIPFAGPSSSHSALSSDYLTVRSPLLAQQPTPMSRTPDSESQRQSESPSKRDSPKKRFFKALCVAVLVYLLFAGLISSLIDNTSRRRVRIPKGPNPWGKPAAPHEIDGSILPRRGCEPDSFEEFIGSSSSRPQHHEDMNSLSTSLLEDNPGFDVPFETHSYFTLPSTSLKQFYLVTRGAHSNGRIRYRQQLDDDVDSPTVDVRQFYWDRGTRDSVKLCMLSHNSSSQGFGIFTPTAEWDWLPVRQQSIIFDIIITLPAYTYNKVVHLQSNVPNFNQSIETLNYELDSVNLMAENGYIRGEGKLHAKQLNLTTTNDEILGVFLVEDSISLQTSNAPVRADIVLLSQKNSRPTSAVVSTINAPLTIGWILTTLRAPSSDAYPGYGGYFDIQTSTQNAAVMQTIGNAPISPSITFSSTTTNGPLTALIWRTFESKFELLSSRPLSEIAMTSNLKARDDPMQIGREPIIKISSVNDGLIEGGFWWGAVRRKTGGIGYANSEEELMALKLPESSLRLATTHGPIVLSYT